MKTVLHVWSDRTDLRPYVAGSKLPIERARSARPGMPYRRLLRLKCVVSEREVGDIEGRVSDINTFCHQHHDELKSLVDDPHIDGVFIDVPYHLVRSHSGSHFEPYVGMLWVVKVIGVGIHMTLVEEKEPNKSTTAQRASRVADC